MDNLNNLIKEQQRLAKRANVRMKAQETKGTIESSYKQAQAFLGERNRFYEGKKWDNKEELEKQIHALNTYLQSGTSTISGYRREHEKITYNDARTLSYDDKRKLYKREVAKANARLNTLESKDFDVSHAYDRATAFTRAENKTKRFKTISKIKNEEELNRNLMHVLDFINSKGSTIRGIKSTNRIRVDIFRDKGVNISKGNERQFNDFLDSMQLKALKKYGGDSETFIEDFAKALERGFTPDEINAQFTEFMNGEKTIDEIEEELGIAEWAQGDWLH